MRHDSATWLASRLFEAHTTLCAQGGEVTAMRWRSKKLDFGALDEIAQHKPRLQVVMLDCTQAGAV